MLRVLALLTVTATLSWSSADASRGVVTLTAYNAHAAQTDSTPWLSACGRTGARGPQVAVSRDLLREHPCGSRVQLFVAGRWRTYTVWDTMNARFTNRIDILMGTYRQAVNFGVRQGNVRWLK